MVLTFISKDLNEREIKHAKCLDLLLLVLVLAVKSGVSWLIRFFTGVHEYWMVGVVNHGCWGSCLKVL